MLDIGWHELLVVAVVTIIVVGPKEIPRVLRAVTQVVRKVRAMASEFQSGIDDLAREAELDDLKREIEKTASTDIAGELESDFDPTGEVTKSVREIETSLKEDPRDISSADTSGDTGADTPVPSATPQETSGPRNGDGAGDVQVTGKKTGRGA